MFTARHNELDKQLELTCEPELWRICVTRPFSSTLKEPVEIFDFKSTEKKFFQPGSIESWTYVVQSTWTNLGTCYVNDLMKKQQVFKTWIICSKFDQLQEHSFSYSPLINSLQTDCLEI